MKNTNEKHNLKDERKKERKVKCMIKIVNYSIRFFYFLTSLDRIGELLPEPEKINK